jgi:preprotein translocase, secE subunit
MTKKPTTAQDNTPKGLMAKVKEFKSYLELSRTEIRKVTWPTVQETRKTSLVVLVFVVLMAFFLGVVDLGLSKLISFILAA